MYDNQHDWLSTLVLRTKRREKYPFEFRCNTSIPVVDAPRKGHFPSGSDQIWWYLFSSWPYPSSSSFWLLLLGSWQQHFESQHKAVICIFLLQTPSQRLEFFWKYHSHSSKHCQLTGYLHGQNIAMFNSFDIAVIIGFMKY